MKSRPGPPLSTFFALAALAALGLSGRPAGAAPRFEVTPRTSGPAPADETRWLDNYFDGEEIWAFQSQERLDQVILKSRLKLETVDLVRRATSRRLSNSDFLRFVSWFDVLRPQQAFVRITGALKARLPPQLLAEAYEELAREGRIPHLTFANRGLAEAHLVAHGVPDGNRAMLLARLVDRPGGGVLLPFTPDLAPFIPTDYRPAALRRHPDHLAAQGLDVRMKFGPGEDLAALARELAGPRDPRALQRYLEALRKRRPTGEVSVPLETLLPIFARRSINTYGACNGPNCFNSGLSFPEKKPPPKRFVNETTLLNQLYRDYQPVPAGTKLELGDLLLYTRPNGEPVHVASYVQGDLLFTKNGMNEMNPYVFQTMRTVEEVYFKNGNFKLYALRKIGPRHPAVPTVPTAPVPAPYQQRGFRCTLSYVLSVLKGMGE